MEKIRKYQQGDAPAIAHFMDKYFPRDERTIIKRSRSAEYYDWKFGPNPLGKSIMYLYLQGNEILGTFGAIPDPLSIRNQKVLAYQLVDAFVAPNLRGKGIFRKLADMVFGEVDTYSNISFGMSPSDFSLPIFEKKYDMYVAPKYCQVFTPIRFDDILKAKGMGLISPLGSIVNPIKRLLFHITKKHIEEIINIPFHYYCTLLPEADFSLVRNEEYVSFRYILSPESYRFFIARDDIADVVIVIKFVKWRGIRLCYLVDVIGEPNTEDNPFFIIEALHEIGVKTGAALVSVELHDIKKDSSKFRRHGFLFHNREDCLFMRQTKWPFLDPSSNNYNPDRWVLFSGDADNI